MTTAQLIHLSREKKPFNLFKLFKRLFFNSRIIDLQVKNCH
jgi:hypothetical protein